MVFTTAFAVGIGLVGQSWISFLGGGAFGLFLGYLGGDAAARDAAAGSAIRLPVVGLRARWRTIIARWWPRWWPRSPGAS